MDTLTKPATRPTIPEPVKRTGRRAGYTIAIAINLGLIYVVHNLLDWEVPSFLTNDFERLIGIVTVSLVASVVANLLWIAYDARWFRSLGQLALNVIGLAVMIRTYQVFPFDVTSGWETTGKVLLILGMIAVGLASVVEVVRVIAAPLRQAAGN